MLYQCETPAFLNTPVVKAVSLISKSRWRKRSEIEAYRFLLLKDNKVYSDCSVSQLC